MVVNELSIAVPAADVRTARQWMDGLVSVVRCAIRFGVSRVLRVDHGLDGILLAPDYPVARWRNDHDVDREARRYILSLTSKSPYLSEIDDPDVRDKMNGCDFHCEGQPARGLGV